MYGLVPFRRRNSGNVTRKDDWGFGSLVDEFFNNDDFFPAFFPTGRSSMKADIRETDKEYLVEAEIPGVDKEEIKLDLDNDTLTICVERNEEKKEEKENYIRKERKYGSFSRSFYIDNINHEKVAADYKDGILKITLPKLEETKSKKRNIDIN